MSLKLISVGNGLKKNVVTPVITSPATDWTEGHPLIVTFTSSPLSPSGDHPAHISSDWELSSSSHFETLVASSYEDSVNKTSWTPPSLNSYTTYYVRVRYRDKRIGLGEWSIPRSFRTKFVGIEKPSIVSPSSWQDWLPTTVTLQGSAFKAVGDPSLTHQWTNWKIYSDWGETRTHWTGDTIGGTSRSFSGLVKGQTYYARVKYIGSSNTSSEWSDLVPFTIKPDLKIYQRQAILASDGAAGDEFGSDIAVSVDGNTAIIGAAGDDSTRGAAYIFINDNGTRRQQAKLVAGDRAANDRFGIGVAISGDGNTAVVGAMWNDTAKGTDTGSAYVYTRSGSTWTQRQNLLGSDFGNNDQAGRSVAISGDGSVIAVGTHLDDTVVMNDAGDRIVVGAPHFKNWVVNDGAAFVFTKEGSGWGERQVILGGGGKFGIQLCLSHWQEILVVGAQNESNLEGAVYVYRWDGSKYVFEVRLRPEDPSANAEFGVNIAVNLWQDTIYVGARGAGGKGVVYEFRHNGTSWYQYARLYATDGASGDSFGVRVNNGGAWGPLFVGATGDDDKGSNSGSVYIF